MRLRREDRRFPQKIGSVQFCTAGVARRELTGYRAPCWPGRAGETCGASSVWRVHPHRRPTPPNNEPASTFGGGSIHGEQRHR